MPRRLSDAVTSGNAASIAAALAKYGYRGPARPREVARWLRAQGNDIDTTVSEPRQTRRDARPNQAAFRRAVRAAYGDRCAITGCDVVPALDAAHIADWHLENDAGAGILLRADLHRLFECGLLVLDGTGTVVDVPPYYRGLLGRRLRLPTNRLHWPRLRREGPAPSD